MLIWEADFYRCPLQDERGQPLWELFICDPAGSWRYTAFCPQSSASANWLVEQLQQLVNSGQALPERIAVFRPQAFSLLETAGNQLGIRVEPTRNVPTLKQWLQERSREYSQLPNYTGQPHNPLDLEKPPPLPLPESLWGEQWRFASLPAAEIPEAFTGRMIPILEVPESLLPIQLGLASTSPIPGVVIDAGRASMRLARWLQEARPVALNYLTGAPDGLILEAGLVDRWVVATFDDPEVKRAAQVYEQRKQLSKGLHFLLVQPDNSGMTFSGFWLLRLEH